MMCIVCNNIFVGNIVRGDVFSSRHSPPLNYFMVPVVGGGGGGRRGGIPSAHFPG